MKWVRRILWVGTISYWVLLFVVTHLPPASIHFTPLPSDKVIHFVAYFVLCIMLGTTLLLTLPRHRWMLWVMAGVLLVYGAMDEKTQPYFKRTAELNDWFADALGVICAMIILLLVRWIFYKQPVPAKVELTADA